MIRIVTIAIFILCSACTENEKADDRPNVLFISIDDLNDWIGVLQGYPGFKTPNIDKFASESIVFSRAYTPAPVCNPSRTAVLTGIRPNTSGIYHNKQVFRESKVLREARTLPQYFKENGYRSIGSGKIFHYAHDTASWHEYWPSINKIRPYDPLPEVTPMHGMPVQSKFFDWGPLDVPPSEMSDWKVAEWISGQLVKEHHRPFFIGCGFYKPHLPWYLPKAYFERHPLDQIKLPEVDVNDLNDVPSIAKSLAKVKLPDKEVPGDSIPGDHNMVLEYDRWKEGVQAYLAAISFVDDCLGKVLDALENSPYKDNTIVVLWSDHGYHLGEKHHWRKSTLWEEATRSVLMIKMPGKTSASTEVSWPVSLIDLYPTLLDLCDLPENVALEGNSLYGLIENPSKAWNKPVLSTFGFQNHSVRSPDWRYTRYADGTEELYDHTIDPLEWKNLAGLEEYAPVKAELSKHLPIKNALPVTSKESI